jgi:hypothetical protein
MPAVQLQLTFQLERMPEIIHIKKRDPGGSGSAYPQVTGPPRAWQAGQRAIRGAHASKARIIRGCLRRQCRASVAGMVIDQEQLPLGHQLLLHRGHQLRQKGRTISVGTDNADKGITHARRQGKAPLSRMMTESARSKGFREE